MRSTLFCLALIASAALSACAPSTTIYPSESVYARGEVMTTSPVNRCRVLDVRQISIGATPNQASPYGRSPVQMEETVGTLLGAGLGAALGSRVGDGNGQQLATAIGTAIGAGIGQQQGARMAQRRQTRDGVEYSVLNAQGAEQVIVQDFNPGDRIVSPGHTCRIVQSSVGARVLPGEHLPLGVARPRQTYFQ